MKTLSVICFFFILSSCNQNKKLEENLGEKVSAEQFEKIVVDSWGSDDIFSIKKNDYAYIEKNISLNYGPMQPSLLKAMTVTNITEDAEVVRYHMVVQSREVQNGTEAAQSSRERVLAVKKTASTKSLSLKNIEDEIQTTPFEGFLDVLSLCSYQTVECYKLKSEDFTEALPQLMIDKGCRSFPDCRWSGKKVSFVVRISYKEDGSDEVKKQNNIISFKIVNNMPYLFKMVEYCFEGLSEYQGQKFPVKICTQVKDTIKGQ
ncbi:MAG: hypothetical protein JNL11_06895 [Bdellovibrionaceae bacterium]|nr:hypothetical protein [Pseudobdellovibrionaceae bacterium]